MRRLTQIIAGIVLAGILIGGGAAAAETAFPKDAAAAASVEERMAVPAAPPADSNSAVVPGAQASEKEAPKIDDPNAKSKHLSEAGYLAALEHITAPGFDCKTLREEYLYSVFFEKKPSEMWFLSRIANLPDEAWGCFPDEIQSDIRRANITVPGIDCKTIREMHSLNADEYGATRDRWSMPEIIKLSDDHLACFPDFVRKEARDLLSAKRLPSPAENLNARARYLASLEPITVPGLDCKAIRKAHALAFPRLPSRFQERSGAWWRINRIADLPENKWGCFPAEIQGYIRRESIAIHGIDCKLLRRTHNLKAEEYGATRDRWNMWEIIKLSDDHLACFPDFVRKDARDPVSIKHVASPIWYLITLENIAVPSIDCKFIRRMSLNWRFFDGKPVGREGKSREKWSMNRIVNLPDEEWACFPGEIQEDIRRENITVPGIDCKSIRRKLYIKAESSATVEDYWNMQEIITLPGGPLACFPDFIRKDARDPVLIKFFSFPSGNPGIEPDVLESRYLASLEHITVPGIDCKTIRKEYFYSVHFWEKPSAPWRMDRIANLPDEEWACFPGEIQEDIRRKSITVPGIDCKAIRERYSLKAEDYGAMRDYWDLPEIIKLSDVHLACFPDFIRKDARDPASAGTLAFPANGPSAETRYLASLEHITVPGIDCKTLRKGHLYSADFNEKPRERWFMRRIINLPDEAWGCFPGEIQEDIRRENLSVPGIDCKAIREEYSLDGPLYPDLFKGKPSVWWRINRIADLPDAELGCFPSEIQKDIRREGITVPGLDCKAIRTAHLLKAEDYGIARDRWNMLGIIKLSDDQLACFPDFVRKDARDPASIRRFTSAR